MPTKPVHHDSAPTQREPGPGSSTARWSAAVREDGYTILPNLLFRSYADLGLCEAELVLILQIWTYWHTDQAPFPSVATLAARMGKGTRQVQYYVERLRAKGMLRVVARRGADGRQLSNAYDLSPLLALLGGQAPRSELDPVQPAARPGVHSTAPEDHGSEQNKRSDPIPQAPVKRIASDAAGTTPAIRAIVARLSDELGDDLPRASISRAERLLAQSGLGEDRFASLLGEAAAMTRAARNSIEGRLAGGRTRGMPYFFAVVEQALTQPARPAAARRGTGRAPARHASVRRDSANGAHSAMLETPADAPSICHDLWPRVLQELQGSLAPVVFTQRVRPLVTETGSGGELVVIASTPFSRAWLERQLHHRIEEVLRQLVPGTPPPVIIADAFAP